MKRSGGGALWVAVLSLVAVIALFTVVAVNMALGRSRPAVATVDQPQLERVSAIDGMVIVPMIDGYDGPAVQVGGRVPIRATLAVSDDVAVLVSHSIAWEEVPLGRRVASRTFAATYQPGPTRLALDEQIPPEVVEAINAGGPHLWRIIGTSTPADGGSPAQSWATSSFWVIP